MAQTLEEADHDLDDHDHEHHENLAHHFDSYEQQFDAGKLGIWIFLVTEVLFFGGLFCAYALYRNLRPEIFAGCSEFLNTQLGAINTGVLLFSSLTMAWAVRCSQLRQHKMLVGMLAATLSCAAIFLGVKAIEYSHKWSMGLLPAGLYSYDPLHPHHPDAPNYLLYISLPFALILVGVVGWLAVAFLQGDKFKVRVLMPLSVAAACFFVGIGLGMVLESGGVEGHGAVDVDKVAHVHQTGESPELVGAGEQAVEAIAPDDAELTGLELLARDKSNPGAQDAGGSGYTGRSRPRHRVEIRGNTDANGVRNGADQHAEASGSLFWDLLLHDRGSRDPHLGRYGSHGLVADPCCPSRFQ